MKFKRIDLIARVRDRLDLAAQDLLDRNAADVAQREQDVAAWLAEHRDALLSALAELTATVQDGDVPIYADVQAVTRHSYHGRPRPRPLSRGDVALDQQVLGLLEFLEQRDDEYVSTSGLEDVGLGPALRRLHDRHARLATVVPSTVAGR